MPADGVLWREAPDERIVYALEQIHGAVGIRLCLMPAVQALKAVSLAVVSVHIAANGAALRRIRGRNFGNPNPLYGRLEFETLVDEPPDPVRKTVPHLL